MTGRCEAQEKLAVAFVDALSRRGMPASCNFSDGWRFRFLGQDIKVIESSEGYRCTVEGTAFGFEVGRLPYGTAEAILDRTERLLGAS